MAASSDFGSFYSSSLLPQLESLELERKKVVAKFWSGIAYGVLAIPALIPFALTFNPWMLLFLVAPFVLVVYRLTFYEREKEKYVMHFKNTIIAAMVKRLNDQLVYEPQMFITTGEYRSSEIFNSRIDRFNGGDMVTGIFGKTTIKFSELHHEEKHVTTDSKGRRTESWVTIFRGIFFIADFNKYFQGKTFVLPESGDFLGIVKLVDSMFGGRGEPVTLENPVFEKSFKCYSSDQVEARYILSTSMMERITKLKEKTGGKVYLSFISSKVFIALPLNRNLFEPKVFSSGINEEYLKNYFEALQLVTGIVADLDLNTRIWSKQ